MSERDGLIADHKAIVEPYENMKAEYDAFTDNPHMKELGLLKAKYAANREQWQGLIHFFW